MNDASLRARRAVQDLRASKIREVANAAIGRTDVIAFWFGESDEVTPEFIRQAGMDAIAAGETFYTHNLGLIELRESIAAYVSRLHRAVGAEHIAVTNSGMSALMLATQALVGTGDRVVVVTPVWPNLVEIPKILGAHVSTVPLRFSTRGWTLDLDQLLDALTPGTRAVYVNSPNNPTGWTITADAQRTLLEHCRRHGIWILADDAYERLVYPVQESNHATAPSFLKIAHEEDRLVSTNTFSKFWLMTGWRLGWIVVPPELIPALATLIEYNTSCAPGFVQRAGIAAIEHGEPVIARTLERFRGARNFLLTELGKISGIEVASPVGAMYAFFRVEGMSDSLRYCKQLVQEAGLGLAPGIAFGPEGEGFIRWCFAAEQARLAEGIARLKRGLSRIARAS